MILVQTLANTLKVQQPHFWLHITSALPKLKKANRYHYSFFLYL